MQYLSLTDKKTIRAILITILDCIMIYTSMNAIYTLNVLVGLMFARWICKGSVNPHTCL